MTKKIIIAVVVVALLVLGYYWMQSNKTESPYDYTAGGDKVADLEAQANTVDLSGIETDFGAEATASLKD